MILKAKNGTFFQAIFLGSILCGTEYLSCRGCKLFYELYREYTIESKVKRYLLGTDVSIAFFMLISKIAFVKLCVLPSKKGHQKIKSREKEYFDLKWRTAPFVLEEVSRYEYKNSEI